MTTRHNPPREQAAGTVVITRVFDAPRELVWQVWTDPKHVAQWWGAKFYTNPVCELDLRPGGALLIHMQAPDGTVLPCKGAFLEIIEPERLVITTTALEDEDGNPRLDVLLTVTFAERGDKTELRLQAAVVNVTPDATWAFEGMEEGWNQSFDKLADYLAAC